jgi:hypothetical protein
MLIHPLQLSLTLADHQWAALWIALSLAWFVLLSRRRLKRRLDFLLAVLCSLCVLFSGALLIFGKDYAILQFSQTWTSVLDSFVFVWSMLFLLRRRPSEVALGAWWVTAVFVPQGLITAGRQSPQDYYLPGIWPAMLLGLALVEVFRLRAAQKGISGE